MQAFDEIQAFLIKRDYLCSACWGDLILKFAPDRKYLVECFRCGPDTPGYVTKSFVEKRRIDSIGEGIEVKQLLRDLNVIADPNQGKSIDELIDDLGF